MAITAADVKKLREMTGAGMMDCKKALTETDGDFDAAVDFLRKKGLATAEKKAGRIAINSGAYADMAEFLASTSAIDSASTVEEYHKSMVATIGENLTIRRFEKVTGDVVVSYLHMGGKIGVLVNATSDKNTDEIKEAMKNIAMQIAAMNPSYVKRDEISADQLQKEKEIIIDSSLADPASLPKPLLNALFDEAIANKVAEYAEDGNKGWADADVAIFEEKKAEGNLNFLFNFLSDQAVQVLRDLASAHKDEYLENKIFAGLVEGRFSKHLKEICLVDQTYVKAENKESVKQYVEQVAKATGANFDIKSFVRFETGEGLEKKNEDFAAEVAAQMNQ